MRAQVSLEYLSTYSWAIVILIAVLAALSYFGFFDVRNITNVSCDSGSFLVCKDARLKASNNEGVIEFKLQNNMNDDIRLTRNPEIIDLENNPSCTTQWENTIIKRGETWNSSECTINTEYFKGDVEVISFVIFFSRDGGNAQYQVTGSVRAVVQ